MKKFKVNADACIGCQVCVGVAPDNFEMDGDKAVVYKQPETPEEESAAIEAMESCPTQAIEEE